MGLFTVDTLSAYGDSASDRQMDTSSKLTNIVDKNDPHHDCYKGCEIICVCFMPNFRNDISLKNTKASSRLVIVLVEQIEH